jgi:ADP-ribose pyrophosphatase YjhB (NUDIX family)/ubiquinone/menaquinone biosynthesis C-methylase UbiE
MPVSPYIARIRESVGHDLLLLPAVAVLPRDDQGRVLLVRQIDSGRWATIGGSVEIDEAPETSAVREAAEEAGVTVEITKLVAVQGGPQFRTTYPNGDEVSYVSVIYEARVVDGRPRPDHDETSDVGWFGLEELATLDLGAFARHTFTALGWLDEDDTKRRLRVAYDARAAQRNAMDDAPWKQAERDRFLEAMREHGSARLLEIGAGHGISGRFFADQGLDVTCIDLSPGLVAHCRAKGLTAHVMDFAHLQFAPDSFDAVFGMNCLLHVPRAELHAVLRSVRCALRPRGLFYWGQYGSDVPFEGTFEDDSYEPKRFFSLLTSEEIQRAAADVFTTVDYKKISLVGHRWGYHGLVVRR